jgi:palmitoyltransferase
MSILEVVPERLIVVFVVLLITFLQLTVNFVIIGPALGGFTSTESLRVLAPLNILLLSIYVNYYLSCTTDPGHVPDEWVKQFLFYIERKIAVVYVALFAGTTQSSHRSRRAGIDGYAWCAFL